MDLCHPGLVVCEVQHTGYVPLERRLGLQPAAEKQVRGLDHTLNPNNHSLMPLLKVPFLKAPQLPAEEEVAERDVTPLNHVMDSNLTRGAT